MTETQKGEPKRDQCYPCYRWCPRGCEIECSGWPSIGPACPAFSREPGCDDEQP